VEMIGKEWVVPVGDILLLATRRVLVVRQIGCKEKGGEISCLAVHSLTECDFITYRNWNSCILLTFQ
jgi:hypothetical protein